MKSNVATGLVFCLVTGLPWAWGAPALADEQIENLSIQADRTVYDETAGTFEATGHVRVEREGMLIEAAAMRLNLRTRKGELVGPVHVQGGPFEVQARGATFDLAANQADLQDFAGHWAQRAQFAGDHLMLGPHLFRLDSAWVTSCMAPQPDLRLVARNFHYFPDSAHMNLAGEGVALRVWDRDVLSLPYFNATIEPKPRSSTADLDFSGLFPAIGFDAYRGLLSGTRFDFSLGENSRGSIPINFSTGRGWSGGIEHALDLGPGEVSNSVNLETPWATGRGGLDVMNAYTWTQRSGGRLEVDADYRAILNGQPVHRIPDVLWAFPATGVAGVVAIHNEVRGGYLWEESSGQQATRLHWASACDTPIFTVRPGWRTWLNATPFINYYIFQEFGGFTSSWNHSQDWSNGLVTSQAVEFNRVYGATPFIHDRQYDTERLRLGLNEDWLPSLTTGIAASWSRINQQGAFSVEDIAVTNTLRWNCFGLSAVVRPLIFGFELHLAAGMF